MNYINKSKILTFLIPVLLLVFSARTLSARSDNSQKSMRNMLLVSRLVS